MISRILLILLFPMLSFSQTITGTVLDASSNKPLETVAVYFDNTTIGTTTDSEGKFSITYTDAIQSNLVFSYLGFEKVLITDYRVKKDVIIKMKPSAVGLDEVFIDFDDGLTRKQKLSLFKREFLGKSKYGRSCKILNENDIILRYDKRSQILTASADRPILIKNRALKYELSFDLIDFEATFRYVNIDDKEFVIERVAYAGTSFYKDIENSNKKKAKRAREKVYKGSVQHFMRALYNENLKGEGYQIYYKSFRVNEWDFFKIKVAENPAFKEVSLSKKVSILHNKRDQSAIEIYVNSILLDVYGNYSAIKGVYFGGAMGSQRIGDTLPLDYNLDEN
ncbi:carboxypeptidase-like regulatory domain-containing protein [Winogradskyella sp.]